MRPPRTLAAGAILLIVFLTGCAGSEAEAPSADPSGSVPTVTASAEPTTAALECPPTPIDVAITYELSTDASGGILITAHSNLPDRAELMGSFSSDSGAYFAQDTAALVNGEVAFGPFSDDGTPLSGVYELSITLPIARNQPDEVQECIGEAGEFITGPLVSKEEITGDQVASLDALVTID